MSQRDRLVCSCGSTLQIGQHECPVCGDLICFACLALSEKCVDCVDKENAIADLKAKTRDTEENDDS